MNKKIYSIVGVIITVLTLIFVISAGAYTVKEVHELSEEINNIQQKQEEFSVELQKIAQNVQIEEKAKEPDYEDVTEDWKVYRNEELGFEVKYPQDFKAIKHNENVEFGDIKLNYIGIDTREKDLKQSTLDLIKMDLKNHFGPLALKTYQILNVETCGIKGIRVKFQDDIPDLIARDIIIDYIEHDEKIYSIYTNWKWSVLFSTEESHNIFVSTFKILN